MDEVLACWLLDKSLESGSADMFPLTNDDDKDELEVVYHLQQFIYCFRDQIHEDQ